MTKKHDAISLNEQWSKLAKYFQREIWEQDLSAMPFWSRFILRVMRIGHIVVIGFFDDEILVRASALTFAAVMSLVPMLAIIFSVLNGVGFGQEAIAHLWEWKSGMPVEFNQFVDNILDVVQKTNFAAIGWIGLATVLILATTVLSSMEESFNRIWGIGTSRNILRRISNYISIIVVVPVLVGIAATITATLKSESVVSHLGPAAMVYRPLLSGIPLLSAWVAFGFLYAMLPNTRVNFRAALISGLFGALTWLGWQTVYINLQLGVVSRNAIYGTFASIPIFLGWLYISWVIVLLGAKVAFAVQNEIYYHPASELKEASLRSRALIAVATLCRTAQSLEGNLPPPNVDYFIHEFQIPVRLLNEVLRVLVRVGWIGEIADQPGSYILLKAPEHILLKDVFDKFLNFGITFGSFARASGHPITNILKEYDQILDAGFKNRTLLDLLKTNV